MKKRTKKKSKKMAEDKVALSSMDKEAIPFLVIIMVLSILFLIYGLA